MKRVFAFPVINTAIVAVLFTVPAAEAQYPAAGGAQACDCSCETVQKFQTAMKNQGSGGFTAEMQSLAACYPQCTQQWMQCARQQPSAQRKSREWNCDEQPNSPVERREWREVCGKPTGAGYWADRLGSPRDDLDRFYGTYRGSDFAWVVAPAEASMEMQDAGRGQIPDGYLMVYATRGDVAPYFLKSTADTRFEYTQFGGATSVAEFVVGDERQATALILDGDRYVRAAE